MPLTEHMELAKPFEDAGFTPPQAQALAGLIGAINQRFNAVDQRFDAIDRRLDAVETRLGSVERELRSLPWKIFGMLLGLLTAFSAIVLGTVKLFLL